MLLDRIPDGFLTGTRVSDVSDAADRFLSSSRYSESKLARGFPAAYGVSAAAALQVFVRSSTGSNAESVLARADGGRPCLAGADAGTGHAAEGDDASFHYGRYEEGERELFGTRSNIEPIQVDSLLGSGSITLFDRLKFAFNFMQDTWSGATPIATAPLAFGGNQNPDPTNPVSGASLIIEGSASWMRISTPIKWIPDRQSHQRHAHGTYHRFGFARDPQARGFKLGYEWNEVALELGGGISWKTTMNRAGAMPMCSWISTRNAPP